MILVVSEQSDYTTKLVLEWLDYYEKAFVRINKKDKIAIVAMEYGEDSDTIFEIHGKIIRASDITSVWFRRGFMGINDFLHFQTGLYDIDSIEDGFKYALSAHSNARQEILE